MTIVVWDGRYVAADSLVSYAGDVCSKTPENKIIVRNGVVIACIGVRNLRDPLIDWYFDDDAGPEDMPKVINDEDHTTLLVWKGGVCEVFGTDMPYSDLVIEPTAWGCGREFAIGAMDAGCDARQACEIAIVRHALLGGPVQVIDLHEIQKIEKAA